MTATHTYIDYLHDILDAAQSARDFVQDMQVEDFIADKRTHFAVVRALNIIGEAAKRLPLSLRESYGQIPWREITGVRDKTQPRLLRRRSAEGLPDGSARPATAV